MTLVIWMGASIGNLCTIGTSKTPSHINADLLRKGEWYHKHQILNCFFLMCEIYYWNVLWNLFGGCLDIYQFSIHSFLEKSRSVVTFLLASIPQTYILGGYCLALSFRLQDSKLQVWPSLTLHPREPKAI